MTAQRPMKFGFQVGPVNITDDQTTMYREVVEDAKLGEALGYDAVFMLEHHFSNYYPAPSPLLFLSHIAAHCPKLGLGTGVLVLPWYQPLRVVSELNMLSHLTDRELHIGIGRGNAKLEYEAFGIDQDHGREMLEEGLRFIQSAYGPQPFQFQGDYYRMDREVTLYPGAARQATFYSAIGDPAKAGRAAEMGVPPLCLANFPDRYLEGIVTNWKQRAEELGMSTDVNIPLQIKCFIADSYEEAVAEAKEYLPITFIEQVKHYESDKRDFSQEVGYAAFQKMFETLRKFQDPANLDPYINMQLVGTPQQVIERVERLREIGFNYLIIQSASVGLPSHVRQQSLRRFAQDVMPHFGQGAFAGDAQTAVA
ncbi:MAG: LLM class flavin-dependent oxidoreductase [Sphingobium sp.]